MGKLPVVSSAQVIKALQKAGFVEAPKRGKGSHRAFHKMEPNQRTYLVIIPKRKEIPRGTLKSILDQANLSVDEFLELLK